MQIIISEIYIVFARLNHQPEILFCYFDNLQNLSFPPRAPLVTSQRTKHWHQITTIKLSFLSIGNKYVTDFRYLLSPILDS